MHSSGRGPTDDREGKCWLAAGRSWALSGHRTSPARRSLPLGPPAASAPEASPWVQSEEQQVEKPASSPLSARGAEILAGRHSLLEAQGSSGSWHQVMSGPCHLCPRTGRLPRPGPACVHTRVGHPPAILRGLCEVPSPTENPEIRLTQPLRPEQDLNPHLRGAWPHPFLSPLGPHLVFALFAPRRSHSFSFLPLSPLAFPQTSPPFSSPPAAPT